MTALINEGAAVDAVVTLLEPHVTAHAGTAPAAVKRFVIKALERRMRQSLNSTDTLQYAAAFCQHENRTAKEIGSQAISWFYEGHPGIVERELHNLANDENWEVREWAASACGDILERHFRSFYAVMETWALDESSFVRRAVVLAVMYAGKSRNKDFAEPILDLVEKLLPDADTYVRDNLGPFAIGSALIDYYPEHVLPRIKRWAAASDEQVRWNTAMIFTAAAAAKYAREAAPVLEQLQEDDSKPVQRAAQRAIRNIRKRQLVETTRRRDEEEQNE